MSRLSGCAALLAASCAIIALSAKPVSADDKKTIANLNQQVTTLEGKLQAAQQQNTALQQQLTALKAENAKLAAALKKQNTPDPTIPALQATIAAYRGAGLVHVVVLKLKSDSSSGETQSLIDDVYSQLAPLAPVRGVWAGQPTAKGSSDPDPDYTVAMVLLFDDSSGLKTYLNDPAHKKFATKHLKLWETPTVYDFEPKKTFQLPNDPNPPTVKGLQAIVDGYRGAGLVHVVILKLKSDSSGGEAQSVIDDTYSQLATIKAVRGVWSGKPTSKSTGTPDAATDYTVAQVVLFDDAAGLKTYLNDPTHTKYADKHLKKWETPTAYDFEPKKASP